MELTEKTKIAIAKAMRHGDLDGVDLLVIAFARNPHRQEESEGVEVMFSRPGATPKSVAILARGVLGTLAGEMPKPELLN